MTEQEFRAWLARDNEERCVLVELDYVAEDEVDSPYPATETLYLSDREFHDDVTHKAFIDVIQSAPQFSRSLSGERLGTYASSIGTLELDNADGNLDFLLNLACDGSAIRFYYGGRTWPLADFRLIFSAITSKVTAPAFDRISVALKDTGLLLNKSIGGTTTVGGTGPNADRSRAVNFGFIHNALPLVIDETVDGGQYTHSDSGTGTAATEVRDRGVSVAFTDDGDGTFRLTAPPDGAVTADVLAEPVGDENVRVSDALDHLIGDRAGLSALGLYEGAGPTFAVHDDDDYRVGVSLPEARNVIDLLEDLVSTAGNAFWAIKRTGEFTFGRLRLNDIGSFLDDSPAIVDETPIVEDDIVPPGSFRIDHAPAGYYRFQAYMSRNWERQRDFATSLSPDDQAVYSRAGLYLMQPESVGTDYENAPELYHKTLAVSPVIDTLLSEAFSPTDLDSLAQWMTTRKAMLLPWIEYVTFVVGIDFYQLELGDPVRLYVPRFGWDDGVLFQVIGIVIKLTEAKIELRIARRNVIQPVPPSWLRTLSEVDHSPQEYPRGATPADEEPIETPTISTLDLSASALAYGIGNNRWTARGFIIVRPRKRIHPDVLLYVTMIGGDYSDKSSYQHTASLTNFTAVGDAMYIKYTGNTGTDPFTSKVKYGPDAGFNFDDTDDITFEQFVYIVDTRNNTMPGVFINWETNSGGTPDTCRLALYGRPAKLQYDDAGFGTEAGPSASNIGTGAWKHLAWVRDGSTGNEEFYVDGVQYLTLTAKARGPLTDDTGYVELGGPVNTGGGGGPGGFDIEYNIAETRMVRRRLYTGAFTPPTMYNLTPIV